MQFIFGEPCGLMFNISKIMVSGYKPVELWLHKKMKYSWIIFFSKALTNNVLEQLYKSVYSNMKYI